MNETPRHNSTEGSEARPDRPRPSRPVAPAARPVQRVAKSPQVTQTDHAMVARDRRRKTLIPILLTLTFMLPALGLGWFVLDADSPLRAAGRVTAVALIAAGLLLAPLTLMNMASARRGG